MGFAPFPPLTIRIIMLLPKASLFFPTKHKISSHNVYDVHGYLAISCTGHPLANKAGIVYIHRYMASLKIGRWLLSTEDAHHIDENKRNNDWRNLRVMSRSDHMVHHRTKGLRPKKAAYYNRCSNCSKIFTYTKITQKYCSNQCAHDATKRTDISRSELIRLLRHNSLTTIGRAYGVSCNAVKQWCRKLNIFYT
jgi:hypothetical protein